MSEHHTANESHATTENSEPAAPLRGPYYIVETNWNHDGARENGTVYYAHEGHILYVTENCEPNFTIYRRWDSDVTPAQADAFGDHFGAIIARIRFTNTGVATRAQALAHARLIAAAPELLAFVRAFVHEGCHHACVDGNCSHAGNLRMQHARALLAKVERQEAARA